MKSSKRVCSALDHAVHRRQFLQVGTAAALSVASSGDGVGYNPVLADEIRRQQKRVLLIWLAGGASQFETWDPKPGRATGGPFVSIPTSVAGVHISELLPKLAGLMDRLVIIRSLDTEITAHAPARDMMLRGRMNEAGLEFPDFGSLFARELAQRDSAVPDFVSIFTASEGRKRPNSGYLGPRYSAMNLHDALRPENLDLPPGVSESEHRQREDLRQLLTERFNRQRRAVRLQGYNSTYARVRGLMRSDAIFDLEQEPPAVQERYGKLEFGQQALLSRRLIEAGVPMVRLTRGFWDSHHDNFESHRELCGDLDHTLSTLLLDLEQRGLLESTLVVMLGEFGRTPKINPNVGRDHYAKAWSMMLAGCGIRPGTIHGKTDADGIEVADGKVGPKDMLATILSAAGIDPEKHVYLGVRPVPLAPEDAVPVSDVLA